MLRCFGMIDAGGEAAFGAGGDFAHANGNVEGKDLEELGAGHVDSFGQVIDGLVALARDDTVGEEDEWVERGLLVGRRMPCTS
ncbi:MAG: hypothetical protein Q8M03_07135 [Legionella sp.]|nr:hypothetical protein [Legionella sp.]